MAILVDFCCHGCLHSRQLKLLSNQAASQLPRRFGKVYGSVLFPTTAGVSYTVAVENTAPWIKIPLQGDVSWMVLLFVDSWQPNKKRVDWTEHSVYWHSHRNHLQNIHLLSATISKAQLFGMGYEYVYCWWLYNLNWVRRKNMAKLDVEKWVRSKF